MPPQYRFRSDNVRDILQRFATQSLGHFGQADSLRICESDSTFDLMTKDSILRNQILIPKQELLVDRTGDIGQHSLPIHGAQVNQQSPAQSRRKSIDSQQFDSFDHTGEEDAQAAATGGPS